MTGNLFKTIAVAALSLLLTIGAAAQQTKRLSIEDAIELQ